MSKLQGFGAALRALRERVGEGTLSAFANRTEIDPSDLSKYEREQIWPSRERLERILDGLGITFVQLALEVETQGALARGEEPHLPAPSPTPAIDFEERVAAIARAVVQQEFRSGLQKLAGLSSSEIQTIADFVRGAGGRPDLEAVALLQSILDRAGERGAQE